MKKLISIIFSLLLLPLNAVAWDQNFSTYKDLGKNFYTKATSSTHKLMVSYNNTSIPPNPVPIKPIHQGKNLLIKFLAPPGAELVSMGGTANSQQMGTRYKVFTEARYANAGGVCAVGTCQDKLSVSELNGLGTLSIGLHDSFKGPTLTAEKEYFIVFYHPETANFPFSMGSLSFKVIINNTDAYNKWWDCKFANCSGGSGGIEDPSNDVDKGTTSSLTANFTFKVEDPKTGKVSVDASSSLPASDGIAISSYEWDVAGNPKYGKETDFSLPPGNTPVKLTVTDYSNRTNSITKTVTIDAAPIDSTKITLALTENAKTDYTAGESINLTLTEKVETVSTTSTGNAVKTWLWLTNNNNNNNNKYFIAKKDEQPNTVQIESEHFSTFSLNNTAESEQEIAFSIPDDFESGNYIIHAAHTPDNVTSVDDINNFVSNEATANITIQLPEPVELELSELNAEYKEGDTVSFTLNESDVQRSIDVDLWVAVASTDTFWFLNPDGSDDSFVTSNASFEFEDDKIPQAYKTGIPTTETSNSVSFTSPVDNFHLYAVYVPVGKNPIEIPEKSWISNLVSQGTTTSIDPVELTFNELNNVIISDQIVNLVLNEGNENSSRKENVDLWVFVHDAYDDEKKNSIQPQDCPYKFLQGTENIGNVEISTSYCSPRFNKNAMSNDNSYTIPFKVGGMGTYTFYAVYVKQGETIAVITEDEAVVDGEFVLAEQDKYKVVVSESALWSNKAELTVIVEKEETQFDVGETTETTDETAETTETTDKAN